MEEQTDKPGYEAHGKPLEERVLCFFKRIMGLSKYGTHQDEKKDQPEKARLRNDSHILGIYETITGHPIPNNGMLGPIFGGFGPGFSTSGGRCVQYHARYFNGFLLIYPLGKGIRNPLFGHVGGYEGQEDRCQKECRDQPMFFPRQEDKG